jgi:hypothetical protein
MTMMTTARDHEAGQQGMSDDEPFLTRWSRRKRDAAEERDQEPSDVPADRPVAADDGIAREVAHTPLTEAGQQADESHQPIVDLSKLPPIESITAQTDIRGFLAPGVPEALTRAALRRAWSADTSIRDFIGLVENDWDVLAPAAAGGVMPLTVTDEMRRMVDAMFTAPAPADGAPEPLPAVAESTAREETPAQAGTPECDADQAAAPPPAAPKHGSGARPDAGQAAEEIDAAPHNSPEESHPSGVIGHRPHGRALPK